MKKLLLCALLLQVLPAWAEDGTALAANFEREVDRRLEVPQQEQLRYAQLLSAELTRAGIADSASQYLLLVDTSPDVQAVFLYWQDDAERPHFVGASPVSTGKPGRIDYFLTPLGVFDHSLKNRDFRAEGTYNKNGIRGLGAKGMRAYDFGWATATRGWDGNGPGQMRLLMHATDPDALEPYLGAARSKGCIRIPATLNGFIDRYGLLDYDYQRALDRGVRLWVLRPDRTPTRWPGRYLVTIDTQTFQRPAWSPEPAAITRRKATSRTEKAAVRWQRSKS